MSNLSVNDEWWLTAKAEAQQRKDSTKSSDVNLGDTFLIVTEGTVTEPTYFGCIKNLFRLRGVDVRIAPGEKSAPKSVIDTAQRLADKQKQKSPRELKVSEPREYDHVWAVIDTDHAQAQGNWNDIVNLAKQKDVKIASSTPCFEFWLLLHLTYSTAPITNGKNAKNKLLQTLKKQKLPHHSSTKEREATKCIISIIDQWVTAVKRSEKIRNHHTLSNSPGPANPSTTVDQLINAINSSTSKR